MYIVYLYLTSVWYNNVMSLIWLYLEAFLHKHSYIQLFAINKSVYHLHKANINSACTSI